MARKIIILNEDLDSSDLTISYAMWLDVPATRQPLLANSAATSRVKTATQGELDSIKSGAIVEVVEKKSFPKAAALATLKAALEARYTAAQAALTATNPFKYYDASFDGSSWTAGGVD